VRSVELTDDPVVKPDGFDLEEAWRSVVEAVDDMRNAFRATVLAEPEAVGWVRGQFGSRAVVGDTRDDGRVEVEIGAWSAEALAYDLASFGSHVEVVSPREARDRLAALGAELVARYGA
jgi:predicted DNA-binding transcriptional regulator YafY